MLATGSVQDDQTINIKVNRVERYAPARWIYKGVSDFKKAPGISLTYGMLYVVVGLLMAWLSSEKPLFFASMVAGFLLIGPIVASGFYCMSKSIERGEKPSLSHVMEGLFFNKVSIASFALVLVMLLSVWILLASFLIVGFLGDVAWGDSIFASLIAQNDIAYFVAVYMLVGLVIASVAFMISVVAMPMMTHRKVDVVTAMMTSVDAVVKNPVTMIGWAFMIATLFVLGISLFFVGLAITLPIIGHASWHAYRDLVSD